MHDASCTGNSPETEVLTHIFTELLMDYLNEYAYYAQVAGLYYHIDHSDGFQVTLLGYNHKLRILLQIRVEKIATFRGKTDGFSLIDPLFSSQHLTNRIVKLERGMNYFYPSECLNSDDENSALLHYIQGPEYVRTALPLGYITGLMQRWTTVYHPFHNEVLACFSEGPGSIEQSIEAFLRMFETKLHELTNDEFKSNVNALIYMKLEKHKNLKEESIFFWREINNGTLRYGRRDFEVEALRQLSLQELIDFFDEYVKVCAPQKKILSV
ncbi:hypothetical protein RIF29_33988 [Crotalaria pallida]|uniref:Uncharacterized protein n=1 Tax=Crotalaria pallida TaxID=3830 RepID=A0AAN9E9M9_CROPI